MSMIRRCIKFIYDFGVTMALWCYFLAGYLFVVFPLHLGAYLILKDHESVFQKLTHVFIRGFFLLLRIIIPKARHNIPPDIYAVKSSVIISNHVSYLDPLILISLFKRHKTIVKSFFFKLPVFGWFLRSSGYIPSLSGGKLNLEAIEQIKEVGNYLASGGNLFVFPEGKRSRDGTVGKLNKGAFKIAKYFKAPLKVLFIKNTNQLFRPGSFLFNTDIDQPIEVELIYSFDAGEHGGSFSVNKEINLAQTMFEQKTTGEGDHSK
jgi:1-acyl-sn-glycerol-3-phosphate acyltransferase